MGTKHHQRVQMLGARTGDVMNMLRDWQVIGECNVNVTRIFRVVHRSISGSGGGGWICRDLRFGSVNMISVDLVD